MIFLRIGSCACLGLAALFSPHVRGQTLKQVTKFDLPGPGHYRKLEDFRVQHAVHTVAIDLKTHRLYTPEQEEDGKPVARMVVYEAVTN
jgi:hypothetical protein